MRHCQLAILSTVQSIVEFGEKDSRESRYTNLHSPTLSY